MLMGSLAAGNSGSPTIVAMSSRSAHEDVVAVALLVVSSISLSGLQVLHPGSLQGKHLPHLRNSNRCCSAPPVPGDGSAMASTWAGCLADGACCLQSVQTSVLNSC